MDQLVPIHQMRVYHNTSAGGQLDIVMLSWSHVSLNKLIVKGHSIVQTPSLFSYNLLQEDYYMPTLLQFCSFSHRKVFKGKFTFSTLMCMSVDFQPCVMTLMQHTGKLPGTLP